MASTQRIDQPWQIYKDPGSGIQVYFDVREVAVPIITDVILDHPTVPDLQIQWPPYY